MVHYIAQLSSGQFVSLQIVQDLIETLQILLCAGVSVDLHGHSHGPFH